MVSIINITLIALRGAHDIADPSSPGNKKLANLLAIVSSQTAVRTCYFAQAVEDPSSLRVLVDWESIEAQEAFLASEYVSIRVKQILKTDREQSGCQVPGRFQRNLEWRQGFLSCLFLITLSEKRLGR